MLRTRRLPIKLTKIQKPWKEVIEFAIKMDAYNDYCSEYVAYVLQNYNLKNVPELHLLNPLSTNM